MPPEQPATCNLLRWQVFHKGFHKGTLYTADKVRRIAANFARLRGHLDPKMGLGHDRAQRLAASLGLPNVGRVTAAEATADGDLYLDVRNVPTWVGAKVNAGRYDDGSVELKPSYPDPADPAKAIPGPVLDGLALLGEEQPAVKGCPPPRATFDDGTEVPPSHDPLPVPKALSASLAYSDRDPTLCFSETAMTPEAQAALNALLALPPDQQAAVKAQLGAAAPTPDPPAPPADLAAKFAAFADECKKRDDEFGAKFAAFSDDMTKRVGGLEAARMSADDAKAKDDTATVAAMSEEFGKTLLAKFPKPVVDDIVRRGVAVLTTATFGDVSNDKARAWDAFKATYSAVPDSPLFKDQIATHKAGGANPRPLTGDARGVVEALRVTSPKTAARLLAPAA